MTYVYIYETETQTVLNKNANKQVARSNGEKYIGDINSIPLPF